MEQYGTYVQQLDCSVNHWLDTLRVEQMLTSHWTVMYCHQPKHREHWTYWTWMNMDEHGCRSNCPCMHMLSPSQGMSQFDTEGKHGQTFTHTHMSCCNKYSVERDDPSKPWRHLKNHEEKSFLHSYTISAMLCNASVQSWCFCSIRYPSLGAGLSGLSFFLRILPISVAKICRRSFS